MNEFNFRVANAAPRASCISAYIFTNQTWQLRSTFLLPSSDQIITL